MKISNFTGPTPGTNPTKATAFSNQQNGSPAAVARQFVNNRKSSSPSYQTCDQFLRFIDSVWLDFTPATMTLWDTASFVNMPYTICGGCNDSPSGKVLHRLVNFGAWLTNGAITNTPPPARTDAIGGLIEIFRYKPPGPGRPAVTIFADNIATGVRSICLNNGKCRENPIATYDATIDNTWTGGQPFCDRIQALPPGALWKGCVWDANYNPENAGPTPFLIIDQ